VIARPAATTTRARMMLICDGPGAGIWQGRIHSCSIRLIATDERYRGSSYPTIYSTDTASTQMRKTSGSCAVVLGASCQPRTPRMSVMRKSSGQIGVTRPCLRRTTTVVDGHEIVGLAGLACSCG
jgi:hypothetical protein